MVKEIVFHLGDCKTGTTSIQKTLATRAWNLPGKDIVYPAKVNHIPLAKTLSVPAERGFEEKRFARVRAAFDESDADYGVISAEHFEFVDPQAVHDAIHRHFPDYTDRIRLIAYVRPHADRLVSTFAERSKKGLFYRSMAAMHDLLIKDELLFYAPRFRKWRALFGDRFTLRPFVRNQLYRSDVVQDFFRYLFDSEDFEITRPTARNESLTVQDIAMMRDIHSHLRGQGGNHRAIQQALGWYMSDLLGCAPYPDDGIKLRLHRKLAKQVVETYRADAAALDAEFFDGTPMSDALEAAPDKAVKKVQSFQAEAHFSAAERRQFEIWAQLLHRLIDADPAHFAWAVRPREERTPNPPSR